MKRSTRIRWTAGLVVLATLLGLIMGPAATWLQARGDAASPDAPWDAVYLVAGARTQNWRIGALTHWLALRAAAGQTNRIPVLIGNDPQISCWCRAHQTNHTCAGWALDKLQPVTTGRWHVLSLEIVPGDFASTDGEMRALHAYLEIHTNITRLALVSSAFHARRLLATARRHHPDPNLPFAIVRGPPYREDRMPWIVLGEYAKLLRDAVGLTRAPWLTRAAPH